MYPVGQLACEHVWRFFRIIPKPPVVYLDPVPNSNMKLQISAYMCLHEFRKTKMYYFVFWQYYTIFQEKTDRKSAYVFSYFANCNFLSLGQTFSFPFFYFAKLHIIYSDVWKIQQKDSSNIQKLKNRNCITICCVLDVLGQLTEQSNCTLSLSWISLGSSAIRPPFLNLVYS